jgi:hypothetical protein
MLILRACGGQLGPRWDPGVMVYTTCPRREAVSVLFLRVRGLLQEGRHVGVDQRGEKQKETLLPQRCALTESKPQDVRHHGSDLSATRDPAGLDLEPDGTPLVRVTTEPFVTLMASTVPLSVIYERPRRLMCTNLPLYDPWEPPNALKYKMEAWRYRRSGGAVNRESGARPPVLGNFILLVAQIKIISARLC